MLIFKPAKHDPSTFTKTKLDAVGGLVQSMRWFNAKAAHLVYSWALNEKLLVEKLGQRTTRPLPPDALYMLERYVLHSVIIEIRALHDRDERSLGIAQIAKQLARPEARAGLHDYLAKYPHARMMTDVAGRDRYLDYVQKYAAIMCKEKTDATFNDHPLSAKAELVRHMSNKTIAHSTLDDYELAAEDLDDVVVATLVIAAAIEAALGDAASTNDLSVSESSGYRAAGLLLHVEVEDSPKFLATFQKLLPTWVTTGQEGPLYSDGGIRA